MRQTTRLAGSGLCAPPPAGTKRRRHRAEGHDDGARSDREMATQHKSFALALPRARGDEIMDLGLPTPSIVLRYSETQTADGPDGIGWPELNYGIPHGARHVCMQVAAAAQN